VLAASYDEYDATKAGSDQTAMIVHHRTRVRVADAPPDDDGMIGSIERVPLGMLE